MKNKDNQFKSSVFRFQMLCRKGGRKVSLSKKEQFERGQAFAFLSQKGKENATEDQEKILLQFSKICG